MGGGGAHGGICLPPPKKKIMPSQSVPKIMTNGLKLDQIWQFQYIDGKISEFLPI